MLKNLSMLAVVLALLLLASLPAIAQVTGEFAQSTDDTGAVDGSLSVVDSGDNSGTCVTPMQFGSTGNEENLRGRLEYLSPVGDDESVSRSLHFVPEQSADCGQAVEQSAAANR